MLNITIMFTVCICVGVHITVIRAFIVQMACTSKFILSLHGLVRFCDGFAIVIEQSGGTVGSRSFCIYREVCVLSLKVSISCGIGRIWQNALIIIVAYEQLV